MNSYTEVIALLKEHCSKRHSGTAFIKTADNKSARFTLKNGEILACSYRHIKGIDALEKIQAIDSAQLSFTDGLVLSSADIGLPKTELLLKLLEDKSLAGMPEKAEPESTSIGTVKNAGPGSKLQAGSDKIISNTQAILTEYVGPMAPVLCNQLSADKDRIFSSFATFEHAINSIAEQISNPKESQDFSTRILEMVRENT